MVILENPYISQEMVAWLTANQHPVLDTEAARAAGSGLNIVSGKSFAELVNQGQRLYTNNENALDWVYAHVHNDPLLRAISLMKDKAATRSALAPMYPNFPVVEMTIDQAEKRDPASLAYPLVLKPSVGFFSVGVHVVANRNDWRKAVDNITAHKADWNATYSEEVVGKELFILEPYIEGDEYAIDAYFDAQGDPVIVNILRHEFSSNSDVSDRMYYTKPSLLREKLEPFSQWLGEVNSYLGVRNFPVHVEVREKDGAIVPIEFNPLRFAGLCTTDISYFAYGFFTYDMYLNNKKPDWDAILHNTPDDYYCMAILEKQKNVSGAFQYERLQKNVFETLSMRVYQGDALPIYGFLFARIPESHKDQVDWLTKANLTEFIH